jgi:threonine dehydrogenase-like Zn-dependent dehydrogenase
MCYTGHYREHGIKQLNGFASEYALSDASFVVKLSESLSRLGVLLEPLTIVEKALTQTLNLQNARLTWNLKRALVLGAGPVGLLATAILRLRGVEVDTAATRPEESLKARLIRSTGARYINSRSTPLNSLGYNYDAVFEVTGNPGVALLAQDLIRVNGIVCYLGIYRAEQEMQDIGQLFTDMVLGNRIHFGSVNANKSYFEAGAKDLVQIQQTWPDFLDKMITRKEKPDDPSKAYSPESEEEIKTVVEFS